ncbi:unnamed protein product [Rotaria sp. Silwood1]|nr:unnamed protein product [Rotaria sp. Silwood1]
MVWTSLFTCLFIVLLSIKSTFSYYVLVDAHSEECFFEKLTSGTKLLVTFEVIEGGFLDIDIKITGPDHKEIYSGERESSGKTTFSAHMDGIYTLCFSNRMSTMTPKMIMFEMDVGDSPKLDMASGKTSDNVTLHHNKLEELVAELSASLSNIKHNIKLCKNSS